MTAVRHCDLLVIGAGPAGTACALSAARLGLEVILVDKATFPREKLCGDFLAPGAVAKLRELGLDPSALSPGPVPLDGTRLRYGSHDIRMPFPEGSPGWALGRPQLDQAMLRLAGEAGARTIEGCRVAGLEERADHVRARGLLASGGEVRFDPAFVVDAGGRTALMPRRTGWRRHARWPRRLALGAWFRGVEGLGGQVEMHVLESGYVGIAPLPGGLAGVAAVFPLRGSQGRGADSGRRLLAAIDGSEELRHRFGRARMTTGIRGAGPLAHGATRAARGRLLLAGDAYSFVDPFTGEGVQSALRCGEDAARAVHGAMTEAPAGYALPPGRTPEALRNYQRRLRRRLRPRNVMARALQLLLRSDRLAEPVAAALEARRDLAAEMVAVTGGLREPSELLRSGFLLRLAGEILRGRPAAGPEARRPETARKPLGKRTA